MPSPVTAALAIGRSGRRSGAPGLIVRERVGLGLASLVARRGQAEPLARAVLATFGVELPTTPRAAAGGDLAFIWSGSGNWLVESAAGGDDLETVLAARLGGFASICDQSDSRIVLELAGPRVRDVLAKGVPIDLHPDRFRAGDVAVTLVGQELSGQIATRLEKLAKVDLGSFSVDRFFLKKSTLTREGPIYEDLAEFLLRPTG